ncbi:MAG TPA: hypothetical protein VMT18_15590 [Planctomycetota bacterium]|nr:hypothetical protein [Planctomycetota bacterium]
MAVEQALEAALEAGGDLEFAARALDGQTLLVLGGLEGLDARLVAALDATGSDATRRRQGHARQALGARGLHRA